MRAGLMRETIKICQTYKGETTATGQRKESQSVVAIVRAEIVEASASEFLAGYGQAERRGVVFRIRKLAGITTADRIVHDGTEYALKEIVPIEYGRGLELRAVAVR